MSIRYGLRRGKRYYERENFNLKELFAINMGAMVDENYTITVYSAKCGSATHDGVVLEMLNLGEYIRNSKLVVFMDSADDANDCHEEVPIRR